MDYCPECNTIVEDNHRCENSDSVRVDAPVRRGVAETEIPKLEKYLLKMCKRIGWKGVYYVVINFQKKHFPNDAYNFETNRSA